ncbi:hypothetical protein V8E51_003805 [Hyaloscypha variabilis]
MSGLEIIAGVAAIVSAFNGSVTLFRSWRDVLGLEKETELTLTCWKYGNTISSLNQQATLVYIVQSAM